MRIDLTIQITHLGRRWLAVTNLAGLNVRGPLCEEKHEALQGLFTRLGDVRADDEISLAVELASEGQSLAELTAGDADD